MHNDEAINGVTSSRDLRNRIRELVAERDEIAEWVLDIDRGVRSLSEVLDLARGYVS